MADKPTIPPPPPPPAAPRVWQQHLIDTQARIAQAVAELSLAMMTESQSVREHRTEHYTILLSIRSMIEEIQESQKNTPLNEGDARALAELTEMLKTEGVKARDHRNEFHALLLTMLNNQRVAEEARQAAHAQVQSSDRFTLPGGVGSVDLTKKAQKKVISWLLLVVGAAVLHLIQYIIVHANKL